VCNHGEVLRGDDHECMKSTERASLPDVKWSGE